MTSATIVPVILSGGSGTRLWPLSRRTRPKQFAPLVGERTMLQDTALRLEGMEGVARPIVVCNKDHRDLVDRQLDAVGMPPSLVVMEPVGRNTAPAAAVAAMAAMRDGSDPMLLVLPADHVIREVDAFRRAVVDGAELAAAGHLVTFGIVPDRPHTGYGYVQRGEPLPGGTGFTVRRFVEKPDEETAAAYVAGGEHSWNSGMFMFTASTYLHELTRHAPQMVEGSRASLQGASGAYGALLLAEEAFAATPADSIDYAVMERTDRAVVIPLDAGWSDVGAWPALWEIAERDEAGNALLGDVYTEGVAGSYVRAGGRIVAVVGLDDVVVVDTADAVLIAARDRAQDVKAIVERLVAEGRSEAEDHE
jgi:mannose-1-phosphate guanylyltransferase/mannose-6-phosphate isomerase